MNGVAATLLAIGLCAAYGTADRVFHDSSRRNPAHRQTADETNFRETRRGWWHSIVHPRQKQR